MLSMGIHGQPYTVIPTLLGSDFGVLGHLWSWYDVIMSWLRPHIHIRYIYKEFERVWAHWYAIHWHTAADLQRYPPYLSQIVGFWVSCGVKMMSFSHGWGWQWQRYLKLLLTSILDIYKEFEHINMLSISIQQQPYTVIPTLLLSSNFGVLCLLWSHNDVIHSWLRLTATWNCFTQPSYTYITGLSHWYAVHWHTDTAVALHSLPTLFGSDFRFWGSLVESKWCHYVMA